MRRPARIREERKFMAWTPHGGGSGPWGQGSSGPQQPDIEELLRRSQERFRRWMPGGNLSPRGLALAIIFVLAAWLVSGFYRVQTNQVGLVMLFGQYDPDRRASPGLHWYFPAPIGHVITPDVTNIRTLEVGFRSAASDTRRATRGNLDVPEESLILTSDQNIADIDFTVFWTVKDAAQFTFNIRDPEGTVKKVAESAMREVIGQTLLTTALTEGRDDIQRRTRTLMQRVLDGYEAGISITNIQLLKVDPPTAVIDAFNEVQRARQDQDRLQNEADAYKNRVLPQARGQASQIVQQARAYEEQQIREGEGEAKQFISVYDTYKNAKDVTIQRMYIETMEQVLKGANKVILDEKGGSSGVVPYLPIPGLEKRSAAPPKPAGTGDQK
jgi:membrane protease subunit HflK